MDWLFNPEIWAALVTLTALEIVLGVDNIIFLSIVVSKLPKHQQDRARILGLAGAMVTRILLLFSLAWLARLTTPWFTVFGMEISGRDLVLILGGLFLLWKGTTEIGEEIEGPDDSEELAVRPVASFAGAIVQIMLIDIVFSVDSVVTAVGMTNNLPVMVTAIVIAVISMMWYSGPLARFVASHPTVKVLALAFIVLIGAALVAEGFDYAIPKPYLYFAMAFSVGVEMINLRARARRARRLAGRNPDAGA